MFSVPTLLFVPATRPERIVKALATNAHFVCIDLEDAVSAGRPKEKGRDLALQELCRLDAANQGFERLLLRINGLKTADGLRDILALRDLKGRIPPLVLPKIDSPEELYVIESLLGRPASEPARFLPLIETTRGVEASAKIARALPPDRYVGLFLGCVDLALELGCVLNWETMHYARSRIVHAGRQAGLGVIDSPSLDVEDSAGLETESRLAAQLGFMGKAAIHPKQLPPIERGFAVDDAAIRQARAIVKIYDEIGGGVALSDGKLVERPVYASAKALLARVDKSRPHESKTTRGENNI